jgi:hypothetical protein
VALGVLLGAAAAAALSQLLPHLLPHLLYGVSNFDPLSYSAAIGLLAAIAAIAAAVAARRALRIDPMRALGTSRKFFSLEGRSGQALVPLLMLALYCWLLLSNAIVLTERINSRTVGDAEVTTA